MIHFGTGGFRAIIGEDFTRANLELISQALAVKMQRENAADSPFIIGYDRRFLSDIGARWCAEVLNGNGIHVQLIDYEAPTPLIMYTVKKTGAKYGIAITASHNPAEYNGVKVFTEGGRDATEVVTNELEAIIDTLDSSMIPRMKNADAMEAGLLCSIHPYNDYIDSILSFIDVNHIKEKELRILLDPMFGVSKTALQTILLTCRCDVDVINDRHDTLFGGHLPSPSAATLTELRRLVVDEQYDLGIATDGDADRIGLIDSKGQFIHPNDILVLLYYYLHEFKGWKGPVVRNIATTHLLDVMAKDFGEICYEVPVGFKHISSKMEEVDALIGGESSGGLTVRGHIDGKDGIYAAALLVEMISVIGRPLADILDDIHKRYGSFAMSEFDCHFSEEKKAQLQEILFTEKRLPHYDSPIEKVSYLDGCKIYFKDNSWIICRFSGTEPLIRIFCEKKTYEEAQQTTRIMRDFLGL